VLGVIMRRLRRPAALLVALGVPVACTLLNPLEAYERGKPADAAEGAAGEAASDAGDASCALSRWPARPTGDDTPGDITIVNALETFSAEPDPDAGTPTVAGYDLDGVCTCPEAESCKTRPGVRTQCDEPGGIDNGGGALLTTVAALGDSNADANARLRSGDYGLLVRIRGYNGAADDSRVEVSVFMSNGADGIQDGGIPPRPRYDGNDSWTVDPRSLAGGTGPPYVPNFVDPNAYVTGHVLVATLDFPMRLGPRMTVELRGSVVTGTLVKDAAGYHVSDGIIAGRVAARALLTSLAPIADPFVPGGFLCGESRTYRDAKAKICETLDIVSDLKRDNTSAPCDALAISAHFTSSTAQLGSVFELPPPATPCGPQWVDDCSQ
jgi:hypothetical protein